jgi:hypothetical protein
MDISQSCPGSMEFGANGGTPNRWPSHPAGLFAQRRANLRNWRSTGPTAPVSRSCPTCLPGSARATQTPCWSLSRLFTSGCQGGLLDLQPIYWAEQGWSSCRPWHQLSGSSCQGLCLRFEQAAGSGSVPPACVWSTWLRSRRNRSQSWICPEGGRVEEQGLPYVAHRRGLLALEHI